MEEHNEFLMEAREELKRLEHIIYVSLKYTRTVDVITNALKRIISTYDLIVEAFLYRAQEEGKIGDLGKSPALRANRLKKMFEEDAEMQKFLEFYTFLKIILNSSFRKREEYRRHVARLHDLENATVEVNIDNLVNCERFVHNFFNYAWQKIEGVIEDDQFLF